MIVHAAGESSPGNLPDGTFAVVLAVPDEASIENVARDLRSRGVRLVEVREPDPPWGNQLMALGLLPERKEDLRRHLSTLPLLR